MLKVFLDLFFIFPLIFFVVTIFLLRNSMKKLRSYQECTGTIIRFCKNTTPRSAGLQHHHYGLSPVIAYKAQGKTYELVGNYYSSWMKVGQEIRIMYHGEDPAQATVKKGLYTAPLVLACLTVGFTGVWVLLIVLRQYGLLPV